MVMYKAPLFSTKTFIIFDVQPTIVFHLAVTLSISGGTPKMVAMLDEGLIITHNDFKTDQKTILKINLDIHSLVIAKLHNLLVHPTIS